MDTVFIGGKVLTIDRSRPRVQAVAVRDGKIAALGSSAEIAQMAGPSTTVVDLAGRALIPGFVDPHTHFMISVFDPVAVNCSSPPFDSINAVLDTISAAASTVTAGRWIFGFGFRRKNFRADPPLTRWQLDEAAPNNPVCIMDGLIHPCYANSLALKLAGIDRDTPDPSHGTIMRDDKGEPTGELWEGATDTVYNLSIGAYMDIYREQLPDMVYDTAVRHLAYGITSVADACVTPEVAAMYREADRQKKIPLMMHQMMAGDGFFALPEKVGRGERDGNVSDRLRGGIMKLFMDPVYPGAAFQRRHADGHMESSGSLYHTQEEVESVVVNAHKRGIQVAIHALGNRAIEDALNVFELAQREHPVSEPRFRIEHGSMPEPEQVKREASLGVIASMQPPFIYLMTEAYKERLARMGDNVLVHPIKTMLEEGVVVAGSSDSPYTQLDPMIGIYALVTRKTISGAGPFVPEEAVSAEEALRIYTLNSAYAMGREKEVGSIEVGKRADLAVLSHDPTAVDPDSLREVVVEQTYVDGASVYRGPSRPHPI